MQNKLEGLIKLAYKKWKQDRLQPQQAHPDEEAMACFLEHRLPQEESERIKEHLIACDACARAFAIQIRLEAAEDRIVPEELLARVKNLAAVQVFPLEIFLKVKEKFLEILSTSGDVLVGQEFVPAPVLRSRQFKDFKDEVTILKDFQDVRVEIKIENKYGKAFNLAIMVKEKATQKIMKDLRVTLLKDDLELESYLNDSGRVTFEHVSLGKYTIEISGLQRNVASVLLDIKI